jgi:hypothetical protein
MQEYINTQRLARLGLSRSIVFDMVSRALTFKHLAEFPNPVENIFFSRRTSSSAIDNMSSSSYADHWPSEKLRRDNFRVVRGAPADKQSRKG